MSAIEERVVSMKFDGKNFDEGAGKTIGLIDRLKQALNFQGAAKGLDSVKDISKKMDLDGLAGAIQDVGSGVEKIASKFTFLGAIGFAAIQNLTNAAISMGKQIGSAVLDPLVEGGRKRALNIEQAKFMFKGMGIAWKKVEKDILVGVKNTAYGLDEAAKAASSLSASGVKLGTEMQNSLLGISGVASMTGSSFADIADIFTKVAGQGRVMGDDLNRLSARGLNGAAVLAKAMGKTEAEVRQMVSKGKISFKEFSKAMRDAYGKNAKDANKTFMGAQANMNAALARIGADFFTPYHESLRRVYNALTPIIDALKKAGQPILDTLGKILIMRADGLVNSLKGLDKFMLKLGPGFKNLASAMMSMYKAGSFVVELLGKAFADVFGGGNVKGFTDFTKQIKMGAKGFNEWVRSSEVVSTLSGIFKTFFEILKFGIGIVGQIASAIPNVAKVFGSILGVIKQLMEPMKQFFSGFTAGDFGASGIDGLLKKLGELRAQGFKPVIDFFNWLKNQISVWQGLGDATGKATDKLTGWASMGESIRRVWDQIWSFIVKVWDYLSQVGSKLQEFVKSAAASGGGVVGAIFAAVSKAAQWVGGFISGLGDLAKKFFSGIDMNQVLAVINLGLITSIIKTIKDVVTGGSSLVGKFGEMLDAVTGALKAMQADLKANVLIKIAAAIAILAAALLILSNIDPDKMLSAVVGLSAAVMVLGFVLSKLTEMTSAPGVAKAPLIAAALQLVAGAMVILAVAIKLLSGLSWEELAKGLLGVSVGLAAMTIAATYLTKNPKGLFTAGIGLIAIATSMLILGQAISMMAGLSWEELGKGLIGVGLGLAAMTIAASYLSKNSAGLLTAGIALMAVAGALAILAQVVRVFGEMDINTLLQGGIALGLVMAALILFVKSTGDGKSIMAAGVGMVALSIGVGMLVGAVLALGSMDIGTLIQGMTSLGILIAGLAIAVSYMQNSQGGAAVILALALALNMLVIPVLALGTADWTTVVQGIAGIGIMLAILVVAVNAMQGAVAGAGALVVVSAALIVLSVAVGIMGNMPLGTMIQGLIGLAGALLLFAGLSVLLAPIAPAMLAVGASVALLGVGIALIGGGVMVFAMGLAMLGPASAAGAAGMTTLAVACAQLVGYTGAILAVGAGFIALGVGLVLAGAGVVLLGAGLVILGVGLTLIAATGVAGAMALRQVVDQLMPLIWQTPQMIAIGAAFGLLGAGVVIAAAGAALFAVSALMLSGALALLMATGPGATQAIQGVSDSSRTLDAASGSLTSVAAAMSTFAGACMILISVASGLQGILAATAVNFVRLGGAARTSAVGIQQMPAIIGSAAKAVASQMKSMVTTTNTTVTGVGKSLTTLSKSVATSAAALPKSTTQMVKAFTDMGTKSVAAVNKSSSSVKSSLSSMASSVGASATRVGQAIISGMVRGMANSSAVSAAARRVALAALNSAKAALDSHSPSKEFEKLGKYANQGFAKGLRGHSDDVKKAFTDMRDMIKSAISAANSDIKSAQNKLKKLKKARRTKKNKSAIKAATKELKAAENLKKKATAASNEMTKKLTDDRDKLAKLADTYDQLGEKLKDAQDKLKDATKVRDDAFDSYNDQYKKVIDVKEDVSIVDYLKQMDARSEATKKYKEDLDALLTMGLDNDLYKEFVDTGLEGQAMVTKLLESGWGGVANLNDAQAKLKAAASDLATTASRQLYQAGVDSAQGLVDGLASQQSAVKAQMDAIANYMLKTIKAKLGIKSPSKEFGKIGKFSVLGLASGLSNSTPVDKAAEKLGQQAINKLQKSLSGTDFDLSGVNEPVIRPIIDMTNIDKASKDINSLLSPLSARTNGAYFAAAQIARATAPVDDREMVTADAAPSVSFTQNNYSPKALSKAEIYRQTKNQISVVRGGLPK